MSSSKSTYQRRSKVQPATPRSKALAKRHLSDSIKYNKSHMEDHAKAMKEDAKALKKMAKSVKKRGK